jgi:hypothetical protein
MVPPEEWDVLCDANAEVQRRLLSAVSYNRLLVAGRELPCVLKENAIEHNSSDANWSAYSA